MLVHDVGAVEQRVEMFHADEQRQRQADRAPQRIAPANPIPKLEHVGGIDAERGHCLRVSGNGDEVFGDRRFGAQFFHQPTSRRVGIG